MTEWGVSTLRHNSLTICQSSRDERAIRPAGAVRAPADSLRRHWTKCIGQGAGHPEAFLVVVIHATLWLSFDRSTFDWNVVATLAVFVMTLFIQHANRRDNPDLHARLDELPRVDHAARSELTQLDEQEPEAIRASATKRYARPELEPARA